MARLKTLLRAARLLYLVGQDKLLAFVSRRAGPSLIRRVVPGNNLFPNARREAIYVHFDAGGVIYDYVVHQISQLLAAGFKITFVTNSPDLSEESLARISPLCGSIIWRENIGYDFGAYKDGIASIADLANVDTLLLMNDSVYGPFWDLKDMLYNINREATDFWGITDSFEQRHHLQSFFLLFFPRALQSKAFISFWTCMPYVTNKGWVIRNGEIKMTQALVKGGLRGNVLAPYRLLATTSKARLHNSETTCSPTSETKFFRSYEKKILEDRNVNPMHYFWDTLICDFHCPFIKRELLLSNPSRIPDLSRWRKLISNSSNYDLDLIENHLRKFNTLG